MAFRDDSPPPSFPTGVRAALRITVLGMARQGTVRLYVRVRATTDAPADSGADTIAIGIFDGEGVAHDLDGAPLQALLDAGEAKPSFKHLALTHADGKRWLLVGLGARDEFDGERRPRWPRRRRSAACRRWAPARCAGSCRTRSATRSPRRSSRAPCSPRTGSSPTSRSSDEDPPPRLEELVVSAHHDVAAAVEVARLAAEATNATRDLQNSPANEMTPSGSRRGRASSPTSSGSAARCWAASRSTTPGWARSPPWRSGSHEEPQLITLRYEPADARRAGPRARRQGGHVRLRRHLDQARPRHVEHEVRHVRRRGGARGDRRDRAAGAAGPGDRRDRGDGEPAVGPRR